MVSPVTEESSASQLSRIPGQLGLQKANKHERTILIFVSPFAVEPTVGFEPTTACLQNRCAAIAPHWQIPHWSSRTVRMVGIAGFEPATPCSQSKCSTRLSHIPLVAKLGFEPRQTDSKSVVLPLHNLALTPQYDITPYINRQTNKKNPVTTILLVATG